MHKRKAGGREVSMTLREFSLAKGCDAGTMGRRSKSHPLPKVEFYGTRANKEVAFYLKSSLEQWLKEWSERNKCP
jgi:hypothetical protein